MLTCFTDASYCQQTNIGVIVCRIYETSITPYNYELLEFEKITLVKNGIKNSELEKIGIDTCIDIFHQKHKDKCIIYTDCQSAVLNHTKDDNIELIFVKGHSRKYELNYIGLIFRSVDKEARKHLRMLRK